MDRSHNKNIDMQDQSFNKKTVDELYQIGDLRAFPTIKDIAARVISTQDAIEFAHNGILTTNPLESFEQRGKSIFRAKALHHQLVLRKLRVNIQSSSNHISCSRENATSNLKRMLEEGVPYRVYRLDVASFYESFDKDEVLELVSSLDKLSPLTQSSIKRLFEHHQAIGGQGVPRGLALSAALSELMMSRFDLALLEHPSIYFSARYVDDIVIISDPEKSQNQLLSYIRSSLPKGLTLNVKKTRIQTFAKQVDPYGPSFAPPVPAIIFDYLGYRFSVSEPQRNKPKKPPHHHRKVDVEISPAKINRVKSRISKSFIAFRADNDFNLLKRRIRFLTSNFSVRDRRTGQSKLAGIYYSYPLITDTKCLRSLDSYLRGAVLKHGGKSCAKVAPALNTTQKRVLLSCTFLAGHQGRTFMHFNGEEISEIQRCWKYD